MAPSELARQCIRAAEGGCAEAQTTLGVWHRHGEEGLEQDHVKAAALFREAADLGEEDAQMYLALCYGKGQGVEQNFALAAEWGGKAADRVFEGKIYARGMVGVKKDLPLGKKYLELCAAQSVEEAIVFLKELRKCAFCGKLDVHHMICAWCRNVRYCGGTCQLRHWQRPADPHKPHCGRRREVVGAGASSSDPTADDDGCAMMDVLGVAVTAARAKLEAAKAAVVAATTVSDTAVTEARVAAATAKVAMTAATAARLAMLAAPAASKKEKKKKAKLVVKVKAAEVTIQAAATEANSEETAAQVAVEGSSAAVAALEAAQAVLQAATAMLQAALEAAT
jgi:hypothetical protein